jgi:hypothetical protein
MMKYDPQEARALAREAKIEAVRSRLAEEAQEASRSAAEAEKANKTFVQDQLEFADSVYARFQKRLLAHISEGYFNKYGDLANPRTVDVMYLLKHKPREAHLDELVYERYDALSDFLTKNPSWDGTVNEKLRDHPGLAAVLRALRKDGFVPRVYEHDQYDHEGGYDGRRFLDWSS